MRSSKLGEFYNCPSLQTKEFTGHKMGGQGTGEGGQSSLPELGRWSWESGEAQSDQVCRADYQRRDLYRKRTLKICKMIPLMSLAEYWSAFVCEETTRVQGKNHPKGLKGKKCQGSHGWEECLFPQTTVKNLISHQESGASIQKEFCFSSPKS